MRAGPVCLLQLSPVRIAAGIGAYTVEALACGQTGALVGMIAGRVSTTPYAEVVGRQKAIDPVLVALARTGER